MRALVAFGGVYFLFSLCRLLASILITPPPPLFPPGIPSPVPHLCPQVRECMVIFLKSLGEGTMFNIIGRLSYFVVWCFFAIFFGC